MRYLLGFIVVALCGAYGSPKHSPSRVVAQEKNVDTVEYCSLLKNSTLFDGKLVRVQAVYRYGYEWSEIYCPGCLTEGRTWVDFDESFERCTNPQVSKKLGENGFKGRTVNLVAVGRFYGTGPGYGHLNAYKFKFVISCVERATIILNDSPIPSAMPKKILSQTVCRSPVARKHPKPKSAKSPDCKSILGLGGP